MAADLSQERTHRHHPARAASPDVLGGMHRHRDSFWGAGCALVLAKLRADAEPGGAPCLRISASIASLARAAAVILHSARARET
jgi:hypothetical protein